MKIGYTFLVFLTCFGLKSQDMDVQAIVDACIEKHGGEQYKNAHYAYDFRKNHYEYHYENGTFTYELHSKDGKIKDVLTNEGFTRRVNGKEVKLKDKEIKAYSNSVNSVHYFFFLPAYLNDAAVNKELVGEATIKGKTYYKVKVTFDENGGGDDHDDIHMYWINKEDFSMDYMGYSFHVNGGGVRFRSGFNKRNIGGIIFQDYINYKHDKTTPVDKMDALYLDNKLVQVSTIEMVNVKEI
ncbi:MAG: hypothetical protein P1U56_11845 [Saprospiraceae bacterium]|nr:hypothetical protein [Saprospiraceae bacterium]